MLFSISFPFLFVTQTIGAVDVPTASKKDVYSDNSLVASVLNQITIAATESLATDIFSWLQPPTSWTDKVSEIGRTFQKPVGDVLDIISNADTSASFDRMHEGMRKPTADFLKTLEGLRDNVHKYTENRLNELETDPFIFARVHEILTLYNELVDAGKDLQIQVNNIAQAQGVDSAEVLGGLEKLLADVFEKLKSEFPPPDHALGHEERHQNVHRALADVEAALAKFLQKLGMSEEQVRAQLDKLVPLIERVAVLIGDLIEQHPILFEVLLFALSSKLTEGFILRPILGAVGLGPYGPSKVSLAAWAQRVFFGASVKKESWFALLQKAGMSQWVDLWEPFGIGAGTINGLFSVFSFR